MSAYDRVAAGGAGSWIDFPFTSPWFDFPGFRACQYKREGGWVHLRGLARTNASTAANSEIGVLPVGFRPAEVLIVEARCDEDSAPDFSGRLNIRDTGVVQLSPALAAIGWVSFDGLSFSID